MPPNAQPHLDLSLPSEQTLLHWLALSDAKLARIDPLAMNLIVAKGIPELSNLDISRYQKMADDWAGEIKRQAKASECKFHANPHKWKNDVRFFRLVALVTFVTHTLQVRYQEDRKHLSQVFYTDPGDLFLHGVMETRRGTCGNLAALLVTLAWRLGWPLRLACVKSHTICRFDDGQVTYNIEATNLEGRGVQSDPDEYYFNEEKLPRRAVACGSDLRALKLREMLGVFIGKRGRLWNNREKYALADRDYLLARWLFPDNRYLHSSQMNASTAHGFSLFEADEPGHPRHFVEQLYRKTLIEERVFLEKEEAIKSQWGKSIDVGW